MSDSDSDSAGLRRGASESSSEESDESCAVVGKSARRELTWVNNVVGEKDTVKG